MQLVDLAFMGCSLFLGIELLYGKSMFGGSMDAIFKTEIRLVQVVLIALLLLIWNRTFTFFGSYRSKRFLTFQLEVIQIAKATAVCTTALHFVNSYSHAWYHSFALSVLVWVVATSLLTFRQYIYRKVVSVLRRNNRNIRYVLIVGTNRRSFDFARMILKQPELGYRCLGFCDDTWHLDDELIGLPGFELVTSMDNLQEFIRNTVIDEVLITLPIGSYYRQIEKINSLCEQQGIKVRVNAELFSFKQYQGSVDALAENPTLLHHADRFIGSKTVLKRLLDFSGALFGLLLLSPVLLVTALAIRLSSPGPAIFRQKRLGKNKRIFTMYKFRTMVQNAEKLQKDLESKNEVQGAAFKITNDPRVTPLGKFLRKTSIDELPQLFNVLKGDMSLIGPRPLPLRDFNNMDNDSYRRRLMALPGITCIWQANGRSNVSFSEWMRMDLEYIDTWSMKNDFRILFQTFVSVLKGTGAV